MSQGSEMDIAARHLEEIGARALSGEELVRALTSRLSGAFEVDGVRLQPALLELASESTAILPLARVEGVLFAAVPPGPPPDLSAIEARLGLRIVPVAVESIDVPGVAVKALQLLRRRGAASSPAVPAARPGPGLEGLGLSDDALAGLRRALAAPQGLVLVAGPRGSGRTTALRAALAGLRAEVVDGRKGAAAVEAALARDPEAIGVDDLSSDGAAVVAVRAAVSGRRVVMVVEASSLAEAVRRFNVDPHLWEAVFRAGLSPRLLRKVCPACAAEYRELPSVLEDLRLESLLAGASLRRGRGCEACAGSGYQGRVAVFEFASPGGPFRPLVADALARVRNGETTLAELAEQVPYPQILQAGDLLRIAKA